MSLQDLREFDNNEQLKVIREKVLNPLSLYVKNTLTTDVNKVKEDVKITYSDIQFDSATKKFKLTKLGNTEESIDISDAIPPEFEGLSISNGAGTVATKVKELTIEDASLTNGSSSAHLAFEWDNIIPRHQEYTQVQIGTETAKAITKIAFSGNEDKVSIDKGILTFNIPKDPVEFKASIKDTSGTVEKAITKILIEGNTTGSEITDDGELKINVPVAGAGGTGGNFQGFFNNLGTLVSTVTNPVNGRSYAFVKDDELKDKYYTPYMYVNNGWTEAPVDPAITYEPSQGAGEFGVFSIKPDTRISVDAKGQLDLSKLGEGHFVGFFNTQGELDIACPRPTVDRSFAYVKVASTGVFSAKQYIQKNDGTTGWSTVTPYGLISAVTKDASGVIQTATPVFGVTNNDAIEVDSGIITIKEAKPSLLNIKAKESEEGVEMTVPVDTLHFVSGIYVDLHSEEKTAVIHHPQRVIDYDAAWEQKHNSAIYLGHLFYDKKSHNWMGYAPPSVSTDPTWTAIAHRGMSAEVKGLTSRNPAKAPTVIPGLTSQDSLYWAYNGLTYINSAADVGLGSAYKDVGLYVETIIQDTENDEPLSPKNRIQIGYTEAENSEIFIRFTDPAATQPSSPWKDWVKTSVSPNDIKNHNDDPESHKETNRFYKVYIMNGLYKDIKNAESFIYDRTTHTMAVADNRGLDSSAAGYFKLPYPGDFRFRGRFELDNANVAKDTWLKGVWVARIYKVKADNQKVLVESFAYEHDDQSKPYPGFSFTSTPRRFEKGESVLFYVDFQPQSSAGGSFIERCPYANFMSWRSYLVLEDSATDAGGKLAETFRKTHGMFYSNEGVGVYAHPSEISNPNSWSRTYAKAVDMKTTGMHSVQ